MYWKIRNIIIETLFWQAEFQFQLLCSRAAWMNDGEHCWMSKADSDASLDSLLYCLASNRFKLLVYLTYSCHATAVSPLFGVGISGSLISCRIKSSETVA